MLRLDLVGFEADADGYSHTNAILLAEAALHIYEDTDDKSYAEAHAKRFEQTIIDAWHTPNVKFISKRGRKGLIFKNRVTSDTQCFIAGNDQVIIIAFKGTEEKCDWRSNLKFRKKTIRFSGFDKEVQVHNGFLRALNLVWDDIIHYTRSYCKKRQSIWITGHSLGGALANLAAFKFNQSDEFNVAGIYTFGQPRVGAWDFANLFDKYLNDKYFRFVNNNDFITFVPPFLCGYAHVGQLYYLTANRQVKKDGLPLIKAIFDRIVGFGDFGKLDHSMKDYLQILRENAPPS